MKAWVGIISIKINMSKLILCAGAMGVHDITLLILPGTDN